jgi:hypothetical protein
MKNIKRYQILKKYAENSFNSKGKKFFNQK